jgi:hypothetical protein
MYEFLYRQRSERLGSLGAFQFIQSRLLGATSQACVVFEGTKTTDSCEGF